MAIAATGTPATGVKSATTGTTFTITYTNTARNALLLTIAITGNTVSVSSISDGQNTFFRVGTAANSTSCTVELWASNTKAAGGGTITVTLSATGTTAVGCVSEYTGIVICGDNRATATGSSGTPSSASTTLTQGGAWAWTGLAIAVNENLLSSSGTLRATTNTTGIGVGLVDSNGAASPVTNGTTVITSGAWVAVTAIAKPGMPAFPSQFGQAQEVRVIGDIRDWAFPTPPTVRGFGDELQPKNFDWRAVDTFKDDTDEPGFVPPPPPVVQLAADDNYLQPMSFDWRATDAFHGDLDEPGFLGTPSKAEQTRFAYVRKEQEIWDISDWALPSPPTATDESEMYQPVALSWPAWIDDLNAATFFAPPVLVKPSIDEDLQARNFDWRALDIFKGDLDEPGQLGAPAKAEQTRFAIPEEETELWDVSDWALPSPPATTDESEMYRPVALPWGLWIDDPDRTFFIPPALVQPSIDEDLQSKNFDWRAFDTINADLDEPGFVGVPPKAEQTRFAYAPEVWNWKGVIDWSSPLPPTFTDESETYQPVPFPWGMWIDDPDRTFFVPPALVQPSIDDDLQQKNVDWSSWRWEEEAQLTDNDFLAKTAFDDELRFMPPLPILWDEAVAAEKVPIPPLPPFSIDEPENLMKVVEAVAPQAEVDAATPITVPTAQPDEEAPERNVDWRALQYEDTDTAADMDSDFYAPRFDLPDEIFKFIADWRMFQSEDDPSAYPIIIAPTVFPAVDDGLTDFKPTEYWDKFQNNLDEPGQLAPPAQAFPTQFGKADEDLIVSDVSDWAFPSPPPTATDESEQYKFVAPQLGPYNVLEDDASFPIVVPAVPLQGFDEIPPNWFDWSGWRLEEEAELENTSALAPPARDDDLQVVLPPTYPFDEALAAEKVPPPPPVIIQGFDDDPQKDVSWIAYQHEDTETQRASAPTPPVTQQIEETEQKNVDWQVKQQEDTETQRTSTPAPPTTSDDDLQTPLPPVYIFDEATAAEKTPPPPPAIIQGFDDDPQKDVSWIAYQHEDTETQRTSTPFPPTVRDDDDLQLFLPPTYPFDEAMAAEKTPPPPPAIIQGFDDDPQKNVSWTAYQHDDTETQRESTPPPPTTADDDLQTTLPPVYPFDEALAAEKVPIPPPPVPQAFDDDPQKDLSWTAYQLEEEAQLENPNQLAPTVHVPDDLFKFDSGWRVLQQLADEEQSENTGQIAPSVIQDEISEKNVDWRATPLEEEAQLENTNQLAPTVQVPDDLLQVFLPPVYPFDEAMASEKTPPPPPPVIQGFDEIELMYTNWSWLAYLHEDPETQRALPPTPPIMQLFEESEQKNVDWLARQYEDTETQRGDPPTPPPAFPTQFGQAAEEITIGEVSDWALPPPPTVQQIEETEQKNVDWIAYQHEDTETQRTRPPTPPFAIIDEISEWFVDWRQSFNTDEETQREILPPVPIVEFEESEQAYVGKQYLQPEDIERGIQPPPPPPIVVMGFDEEFVLQQYIDWRFYDLDDDTFDVQLPQPPFGVLASYALYTIKGAGSVTPTKGIAEVETVEGCDSGVVKPVTGISGIISKQGKGKVN